MKKVDIVSLTSKAIAQTMGANFMTEIGDFSAIDSYKLADIGKQITGEDTINSLNNNLIAVMGKHIIDNRLYTSNLPSLYVESFDWGGYLVRTRFGLSDIIDDPMFNLVNGKNYADIEHTYYEPNAKSKYFEECKPIMTPISTQREVLREAFTSWEKLDLYISGIMISIQNTINIALMTYEKMLVSCAVAISDKANDNAIHLITEATNLGIISKINESDGVERNKTYEEIMIDKNEKRAFLLYACERIKKLRTNMKEPSEAFNDGSIVTWCDREPNLILLSDFSDGVKFNLTADTFNPSEIGIGQFDTITSWQAIKGSVNKEFDREIISSINISADANNKLGIGTGEYKANGVIGLMFDYKAIGISLQRNKVTSSYTACADFWNTFSHVLVNYLIDASYGIVAFICD